jgi:hypothetical protein
MSCYWINDQTSRKFQYIFAFPPWYAATDNASTISNNIEANDLIITGSYLSTVSAAVVKANSYNLNIKVAIPLPAAEQRQPCVISSRDFVHCFPEEMNKWLAKTVVRK